MERPRHTTALDFATVTVTCQVCTASAFGPALCARCGKYGHPHCLRMVLFHDYAFCGDCYPQVKQDYNLYLEAQNADLWKQSTSTMLATWKQRAMAAIGLSTTAGVVVGGAVASMAGGAAGLVSGVVQGMVAPISALRGSSPRGRAPVDNALSYPEPAPVEPEAGTVPQAAPTNRPRRGRSVGDRSVNLRAAYSSCPACWTENRGHKPHTNTGDCQRIPGGSTWKGLGNLPMEAEHPRGTASSRIEALQREAAQTAIVGGTPDLSGG